MQPDKSIKKIEQIGDVASTISQTMESLASVADKFALNSSFSVFNGIKRCGISVKDVLRILLFLPFLGQNTIFAMFKFGIKSEAIQGKKDAHYGVKNNEKMNWRKLLTMFAKQFMFLASKENKANTAENSDQTSSKTALIIDDTLLAKTGVGIEKVSIVFDHVTKSFMLGFKLLACVFWDGTSIIPVDFTIHRERGRKIDKAVATIDKLKSKLLTLWEKITNLKNQKKEAQKVVRQNNKTLKTEHTKKNEKELERNQKSLQKIEKQLINVQKEVNAEVRTLEKLERELLAMQEKSGLYGLSKKESENQFKKQRDRNTAGYKRAKECDTKKTDSAIAIIKRAVKNGFVPDYVMTDSWFFCYELLKTVIDIGRGVNLLCMAKIGTSKYTLLENNKAYYPAELILLKGRNVQYNRKHKARFIKIQALYDDIRVNMFFVSIGKDAQWHLLITSDLTLIFQQVFETYKIRWSIEVFFNECKGILQLGKCTASDFDAHIADISLIMFRYILLSYYKRIHYNQTMGDLFHALQESVAEENVVGRLQKLSTELIELFAETSGIDVLTMYADLLQNPKAEKLFHKNGIDTSKIQFAKVA